MQPRYFIIMAGSLLLNACGEVSVKDTLGLDQRAPDEFRVVSRPPLSVPPQFDLRPPGVTGENMPATRTRAQSLMLGNTDNSKDISSSKAEATFLQKAGVDAADPNIKKELTEQKINEQLQKEEKGWWSRVTVIPEREEPVVKANDEAERIKKNKEEGKPITEGDTPETGGGTMSTIEHWFGDW